MSELVGRLEAIEAELPTGPWELWTSCSYRRIKGPIKGPNGRQDVLSAYLQRSDNHPDLSMPEEQLHALVALRNALPEIVQALRDGEKMRAALATVLTALDVHRNGGEYPDFDAWETAARSALAGEGQ